MERSELEQQITRLAALDEPVRRSLYFYVVDQQRDVSREEAARAVGVSRGLAGFHLDRLARDGLLETSFQRLTGRAGPGAGRPAKLYRRSARQLEVSLPQRSYELAARILAESIAAAEGSPTDGTLQSRARLIGERIGAEARARAGSRPSRKKLRAAVLATLAANGYEPVSVAGEIRLRNCPFHALVSAHRDLVCGMNLALLEGVVEGLALPDVNPVLDPQPGMCCVALRLAAK